jgi:hypothetical protein
VAINSLDACNGDSVASEFLDALARQDWAVVQSLLDHGVSFRVLMPRALREADDDTSALAWIIHGGRSERRGGTRAARQGDCWRDGGGPSTVGLLRGRRCSVISEMVGEEAVSGDLRARLHAGQVVLREDLCYQFPSAVHSRLVEDRL